MSEYKELLPEITLKYKKQSGIHKVQCANSNDSASLFRKFYDEDTIELCESVVALYLDAQLKSIGWFKVSQGGMSETVVDIKLILATALKCGANAIMLSHNHPSGCCNPSEQDNKVTKKISEACKVMDIRFVDHVILSGDNSGYYSYADNCEL